MNIRAIMISCKEATLLVEKKSIFGLSVSDRFRLKLHTIFCGVCRRYQFQSTRIDRLLHQYLNPAPMVDTPLIQNQELKKTIIKNL